MVTVCPSQFATRRTLFHVLVGCGLLMLKVSRLKLPVIWLLVSMWRSEERFSRNAETDLVCRLLLDKKKLRVLLRSQDSFCRFHVFDLTRFVATCLLMISHGCVHLCLLIRCQVEARQ